MNEIKSEKMERQEYTPFSVPETDVPKVERTRFADISSMDRVILGVMEVDSAIKDELERTEEGRRKMVYAYEERLPYTEYLRLVHPKEDISRLSRGAQEAVIEKVLNKSSLPLVTVTKIEPFGSGVAKRITKVYPLSLQQYEDMSYLDREKFGRQCKSGHMRPAYTVTTLRFGQQLSPGTDITRAKFDHLERIVVQAQEIDQERKKASPNLKYGSFLPNPEVLDADAVVIIKDHEQRTPEQPKKYISAKRIRVDREQTTIVGAKDLSSKPTRTETVFTTRDWGGLEIESKMDLWGVKQFTNQYDIKDTPSSSDNMLSLNWIRRHIQQKV